jgi:hypothetical protein
MQGNFEIVNQKAVSDEFKKLAKEYPERAMNALYGFAIDVRSYVINKIKAEKHIITGRLWQSIHWQGKRKQQRRSYNWLGGSGSRDLAVVPSPEEVYVGTNVEYADDVIKGQRYTSDALLEAVNNIDFNKHINDI